MEVLGRNEGTRVWRRWRCERNYNDLWSTVRFWGETKHDKDEDG
ncbi:hypothetical protein A2U01_0064818, partial [Trifolium medium]|nr:hypothetical protein [Trifolium medium]